MRRSYFAVCDSVDGSGSVVVECRSLTERRRVIDADPQFTPLPASRARSAEFRNDYHIDAEQALRDARRNA